MKTQIFKIQKPIHSSDPNASCLIYNKDRSAYGEVELTPELSALMGSSYKIYVRGYMDEKGLLNIEQKIPRQRW